MVSTTVDTERAFDDERFRAVTVHRSDRAKTVLGYFAPGQFIPVHAPASDVTITVLRGTGVVRDGDTDHHVEAGDVVVVPAGVDRGVRAGADEPLEATLVTAPPPTDAEHDPVREGLRRGVFDPQDA